MFSEKPEIVVTEQAHRRRAMESFRSILDFLTTNNKTAVQQFVQVGDRFELNLEKSVPNNPYHRNLILIFEPTLTSGGAKFSLRADGRYTITIFVTFRNTKEMWQREFQKYVREWFLSRRSSYVHEFTHYLDIRETELDKIVPPDPKDNKAYYNHPSEVRAFIQQALSDIEDDTEVKLLNQRKHWVREFGMTADQFVSNAMRKYFNPEFIRYLSPENKRLAENELRKAFPELIKALKEMPIVTTTTKTGMKNEDNVLTRILHPPVTPNLTLKMAYQDQKDQEEADKDMSKKAIMQYVREVAEQMMAEAFGSKDSNTKDGKDWKDIDKIEKLIQVMPNDEPDQKKEPLRRMGDMFPHADNLGGVNQQFGESSTFGSDSFQGSAFGFGGKQQLANPTRYVPPEQLDTTEMQLPSSRSRGGLNNPNAGPDKLELGSADFMDDDEGLNLYNSLTEQPTYKKKPKIISIETADELFGAFHLSRKDLGPSFVLTPRVPAVPYFGGNSIIEDDFTPRVSFAPTIERADEATAGDEREVVYAVLDASSLHSVAVQFPLCQSKLGIAYGTKFDFPGWLKYLLKSNAQKKTLTAQEERTIRKMSQGLSDRKPSALPPKLQQLWKGCVPDARETQEYWATKPIKAYHVGNIFREGELALTPLGEKLIGQKISYPSNSQKLRELLDNLSSSEDDLVDEQSLFSLMPDGGEEDEEGNTGSAPGTTGGASQQGMNNTTTEEAALEERTESDALYRDLQGMAVDPDANDKNFIEDQPAPEEYGSAHHVGGFGKIMAPHKFVPENKARIIHKHLAEEQGYRSRMRKLSPK